MFSAPAPMELIVILGIALLVLGPKRLPEAARSVGRGVREFRQTLSEASVRITDDHDEEEDDLVADEDEDVAHDTPEPEDEFGDSEDPVDESDDTDESDNRPERADAV